MPEERVVITRNIPGLEEALQDLPPEWSVWVNPRDEASEDDLIEEIENCTGLLCVNIPITERTFRAARRLRVVSNYGVGVDHIDLEAAKAHGVAVANLPDEVTYSTAEMAMALMLACVRRIGEADRFMRKTGGFPPPGQEIRGNNLRGKTLGLLGFGRIGQAVGRMAGAFGMKLIYHARRRRTEAEEELDAAYRDLPALLREADVLSIHVPGGEGTRHLVGREELAQMRPSAVLINTARGTVVDEQALVEALRSGKLKAAGLDVYEREPELTPGLTELENVVLAPHIGTSTWETRLEMTKGALRNLAAALQGRQPSSRVV